MVESLGHACLEAQDGLEAWKLITSIGVESVITDWSMPGMDGVELCRIVRSHQEIPYVYFMMLTMHHDKGRAVTAIRAGADDFLVKPLDLEDLAARLVVAERVVGVHRQLKQWRTRPAVDPSTAARLEDGIQIMRQKVDELSNRLVLARANAVLVAEHAGTPEEALLAARSTAEELDAAMEIVSRLPQIVGVGMHDAAALLAAAQPARPSPAARRRRAA